MYISIYDHGTVTSCKENFQRGGFLSYWNHQLIKFEEEKRFKNNFVIMKKERYTHLKIFLSRYPCAQAFYLSIHIYIYLSNYISIHLSIHLSIQPSIYQSIFILQIYLSTYITNLSIYLYSMPGFNIDKLKYRVSLTIIIMELFHFSIFLTFYLILFVFELNIF